MGNDDRQGCLLVVDDDRKTAELVAVYLRREGYRAIIAHDGAAALELAALHKPRLIILDLMLPRIDGREVCSRLRRSSTVPIIMLTARAEEKARIEGLALGADDYVVKPFSPRELVERVKAVLRRTETPSPRAASSLTARGLVLERDNKRVKLRGRHVALTPSEYTLLETLMEEPNRVFSREELIGRLYPGGDDVVPRVVDVHMGELRRKIEKSRSQPEFVVTVRGFGYKFAAAD